MYNTPQNYSGNTSSMAMAASGVMKKVYMKMTFGLLVTALTAQACSVSEFYWSILLNYSWVMWLLFGAEFLIVISVSGAVAKMKSSTASLLFYLFALINGLSLAPIFIVYTGVSIAKTFFITAGTFAAMSVYGYFTTKDLSRFGSILVMALIGLIIASIVNIFAGSSTLDWIITFAGVIIFVGLTAWDTQKIKQWSEYATPEQYGHIATIGALSLYLDFINMFLYLLRLFGDRR
ncbi:MAG: Bax inhibitor-1/YccA family protein [Muribaculaceae bacterium]|nr:Bax inhibitor-1/YccA family protein [Muribaculaceae bacterium]